MGSDDFEIATIRQSISDDWRALASGELTGEQRKARREHLEMSVEALRNLVQRSRLAKKSAKLREIEEWDEKFIYKKIRGNGDGRRN